MGDGRGRNDGFGGHQAIAEGMNMNRSDVGHLVVYFITGGFINEY